MRRSSPAGSARTRRAESHFTLGKAPVLQLAKQRFCAAKRSGCGIELDPELGHDVPGLAGCLGADKVAAARSAAGHGRPGVLQGREGLLHGAAGGAAEALPQLAHGGRAAALLALVDQRGDVTYNPGAVRPEQLKLGQEIGRVGEGSGPDLDVDVAEVDEERGLGAAGFELEA